MKSCKKCYPRKRVKMKNKSGITPVGHRVLVLPEQVETTTSSGIIVTLDEKREALAQMYGVVVAMGDSCYRDQSSQWCKEGDRVSFAKYSGLVYKGIDGKDYRCINDLDIVSLVEEGVK